MELINITNELLHDTITRVVLSLFLLVLILILSKWQRLGMEKSFIISFTRGLIQIVLLALILVIIFNIQNAIILYLYLVFMCVFAAFTTSRTHKYTNIFQQELVAVSIAGLFIMTVVIVLGIIPLRGEYVIPMGGMVISNAMVLSTIALERFYSEVRANRGYIEVMLALGASPSQAMKTYIRRAYKASLVPTNNRMAILGIVSIPGLMSGMIIGGADPLVAAIFQIIIFLMILSSGFIADIIIVYLLMKEFFTKYESLNLPIIDNNAGNK